jgi:hypothetical protein
MSVRSDGKGLVTDSWFVEFIFTLTSNYSTVTKNSLPAASQCSSSFGLAEARSTL